MKPINFPQSNHTLAKPEDMTDEQCGPIDACMAITEDEMPITIVCWEPTPDEWIRMRQRGHIFLSFIGHQVVPHIVWADSPFEDTFDSEKN